MTIETYNKADALVRSIRETEKALTLVPRGAGGNQVFTSLGTVELTDEEARAVFGALQSLLEARKAKLLKELEAL